ncbi:sensor histidine kinase [Psychrobacter aestuarii]|nr:HAMP domain-containing sensor histidine kinase [Psychrobacter aestuarii]
MRTHKTVSTFIQQTIIRIMVVTSLVVTLFSIVYGCVYHYQQKRIYVEELAEMLAVSAAAENGAEIVAQQVSRLLEDDSNIQSIVFYSTDYPVTTFEDSESMPRRNDWSTALFAHNVSFNRAVTAGDLSTNNALAETQNALSDESETRLKGYINVTLDVEQMRYNWIRYDLLLWLGLMAIGVALIWLVIRQLNWPTRNIAELASVCEVVNDNPELKQLPVIQQNMEFDDLRQIRRAFINLFNRLQTAEKKIEDFADLEEKLRNKDLSLDVQRHNFQSMITHELKTSLNAISGGLQLLNPQYLNTEQKDILNMVRKGSQHLDSTLEQIIQLNKIERGQVSVRLTTFNPLQLLADIFAEFEPQAKQKQLELISKVHHVDYALEGDVEKIKQVLGTLLENALKFTHAGEIVVESELKHFDQTIRWQVTVADTGIGIEEKYLDDIFTPFFQVDPTHTREHEGAGVGLPVIKQILHLLGASIDVKSQLGAGSKFKVVMPLRNTYQPVHMQQCFAGLSIHYYYESTDSVAMVEVLQRLGAQVDMIQQQQALSITTDADVVMIAEDVLPDRAIHITHHIRDQERHHRPLLIYWYPEYKFQTFNDIEHELKSEGIDYCHASTESSEMLYTLLQKWLGWL